MVKNSGGGGGAKKQGRKFQNNGKHDDLRLSENKNELYAIVDKNHGNGVNVYTCLGHSIWCRVPGKFKGRNKRNNFFDVHTWVLVTVDDTKPGEEPEAGELAHIYTRTDIDQLRNLPGTNVKLLVTKMNERSAQFEANDDVTAVVADNSDDGFIFTENVTNAKTMFVGAASVSFDKDEEVDIDDL